MALSLSLLFPRVRAAVARCGFASRGMAGPGSAGREPDSDSDWEPEERALQEVESTLKRQKIAMQWQKIRRQMEAPGAPPRTLTWEAMEQIRKTLINKDNSVELFKALSVPSPGYSGDCTISQGSGNPIQSLKHTRYLHKEFAESWSVPRLAEGFNVSTDVIRRVLKSKFVPTLEKKLKQDQKVLKKAGFTQGALPLPISENALKPLSAGHSVSGSLLMPGEGVPSKSQDHSTALKVVESNTHSPGAQRRQEERRKRIQGLEESVVPTTAALGHQRELHRYTPRDSEAARRADDDRSPSVEKLEELKAGEPGDQNFSSKVVQRGREFFDSNGNFLYRI